MTISIRSLSLSAGLALFALACGGKAPSVDQAKKDFNSPSGSVSDQQSIIAISGKQDGSNSALAIAGGASGFGAGASGLTAGGQEHPFAKFNWQRLLAPEMARWRNQALAGKQTFELSGNPLSGCANAFANAKGGTASGNATAGSYSFSFNVDLGSQCAEAGATGKISMSGEVKYDQGAKKISYKIDQSFAKVCQTGGNMTCVDGTFHSEADIDLGNLTAMATTGGAGGISFFTVWGLDTSWNQSGKARKASTKGGMRVKTDSTSGAGSLEYLFYVNSSKGTEVSFVLTASTDGMGNSSLSIKGADGTLNCSTKSDGSGSCMGAGTLTWTADEYEAAASANFDSKK